MEYLRVCSNSYQKCLMGPFQQRLSSIDVNEVGDSLECFVGQQNACFPVDTHSKCCLSPVRLRNPIWQEESVSQKYLALREEWCNRRGCCGGKVGLSAAFSGGNAPTTQGGPLHPISLHATDHATNGETRSLSHLPAVTQVRLPPRPYDEGKLIKISGVHLQSTRSPKWAIRHPPQRGTAASACPSVWGNRDNSHPLTFERRTLRITSPDMDKWNGMARRRSCGHLVGDKICPIYVEGRPPSRAIHRYVRSFKTASYRSCGNRLLVRLSVHSERGAEIPYI